MSLIDDDKLMFLVFKNSFFWDLLIIKKLMLLAYSKMHLYQSSILLFFKINISINNNL